MGNDPLWSYSENDSIFWLTLLRTAESFDARDASRVVSAENKTERLPSDMTNRDWAIKKTLCNYDPELQKGGANGDAIAGSRVAPLCPFLPH